MMNWTEISKFVFDKFLPGLIVVVWSVRFTTWFLAVSFADPLPCLARSFSFPFLFFFLYNCFSIYTLHLIKLLLVLKNQFVYWNDFRIKEKKVLRKKLNNQQNFSLKNVSHRVYVYVMIGPAAKHETSYYNVITFLLYVNSWGLSLSYLYHRILLSLALLFKRYHNFFI